ncbi:MAG: DegT/DnrJ/EryC1/StrS family aminotransferase [Pseudomonadota bacterium]|nr:DegT/DnrJ/EryC1/StrS family aminotransferase [Pseudomonadota bacterium]MDE3038082.1 DegT/DnrJ/EryC1/StrS family aminotransferase [Pseudomonadota bacterium]
MIPLVREYITDIDTAYLHRRIEEGLLSDESEVGHFEHAFAARVGAAGAVAVNSGTSALHVALLAVGVGEGDEVILPSYTCVALLHAVRACGAIPVLADNRCDVRAAQFHMTQESIRKKLTSKTRAAIISHMFGTLEPIHPVGLPVPVIEDFTLSLGAQIDGKPAGSLGTIGVCSLHHSKMISCGQGGMVVTRDAALLDKVRQRCNYDEPMARWRFQGEGDLRGGYQAACSYGMSSLQAALGVSQLSQLDVFLDQRRVVAQRYSEHFSDTGLIHPNVAPGRSSVFFRYMIYTDKPVPEILRQCKIAGIEAGRGVYPPLHVLLGLPDDEFPSTTECINHLLSVPLHPDMSDEEVEYTAQQVTKAVA